MKEKPRIVVLVGPTASGKTGLALDLAERFQAEIISADAVAVYKGFDIGSAKPSLEEQNRVRHHLIDVVEPDQDFTAALFAERAGEAVEEITARGARVLVAGGTGLYVKALLGGLFKAPPIDPDLRQALLEEFRKNPNAAFERLKRTDPRSAARLQPRDGVRVVRALEVFLQTGRTISSLQEEHSFQDRPYDYLKLGLQVPRETLVERITQRTRDMLDQGLVEEVRALLDKGAGPDSKPMRSIGYAQALAYVRGEMSLEEAAQRIVIETKRLAKRQMTWFRADPELQWLPGTEPQRFMEAVRGYWEG
jgi:tRNA dimethylallyltransferase